MRLSGASAWAQDIHERAKTLLDGPHQQLGLHLLEARAELAPVLAAGCALRAAGCGLRAAG